jgi:hypothetical protein
VTDGDWCACVYRTTHEASVTCQRRV